MKTLDKFYLRIVSGLVLELAEATHPSGEPLIDDEIADYLNPLAFMDHYTALPSDRWAGEFRRAHAVALELCERYGNEKKIVDSQTGRDIAKMVIISLQTLAKYDCPAVLDEMTQPEKNRRASVKARQQKNNTQPAGDPGKDRQAEPVRTPQDIQLPPEFDVVNVDALTGVFNSLVNAGYLDKDWQPIKGVQLQICAYIAHELGALLCMTNWAKAFETFWGKSNFSQSYKQLKGHELEKQKICAALCSAIRKTPSLLSTFQGQNLLKNAEK